MGWQECDKHFAQEVEEVSYPLGEDDRYTDESKDILKSILNEDTSTGSEGDVNEL